MLEVAGRPFVDWQLMRLADSGIDEVVMCVAYLGEQIRQHVGDGARFQVRVSWSDEGPKLLGTAGALRAALPLLSASFVVTYGDSYLPFDYTRPLRMLESNTDCDAVMTIFRNAGRWDRSNVATDGEWVRRYDKVSDDPELDHIDYGAIALRRNVVAELPENVPRGLDVIQRDLAQRGRVRACIVTERFYEIGSPEGLADLDRHLRADAKRPPDAKP
jgi:N-acetyl-alpha-D-muramate 1-phosphate uridylyltransferase